MYAWCCLVMLDPAYALGAIVMARSLDRVNTAHQKWCMYTADIEQKYVDMKARAFDKLILVPILQHRVNKLKSRKQNEIYGSWIEKSFTKWNILNPDLFDAEKVILVDADMIFLENCDDLFDLPAPSATFSSPWCSNYMDNSRRRIYNPYTGAGELAHGDLVRRENIKRGFNNSILCLACMVLVEPKREYYDEMMRTLFEHPRFGNSNTISGQDEQLLVRTFLNLEIDFHHIHQMYNWIAGKWDWLDKNTKPKTIQYYNTKPWNENRATTKWDDVLLWYEIADECHATI